jgi:hypothetical protein
MLHRKIFACFSLPIRQILLTSLYGLSYWEVDIWGWSEVGWLRFGLNMITKCPHQAARLLLPNEQTHDIFQICMRCTWPISAHNSIGCGFDPGRCTKNASLEKIYLLGRMDFSRESWMLQPATDSARTYTVCFGACTGSPIVRNGHVIVCGRA